MQGIGLSACPLVGQGTATSLWRRFGKLTQPDLITNGAMRKRVHVSGINCFVVLIMSEWNTKTRNTEVEVSDDGAPHNIKVVNSQKLIEPGKVQKPHPMVFSVWAQFNRHMLPKEQTSTRCFGVKFIMCCLERTSVH